MPPASLIGNDGNATQEQDPAVQAQIVEFVRPTTGGMDRPAAARLCHSELGMSVRLSFHQSADLHHSGLRP